MLNVGQASTIEACDSTCESIDELFELSIWNGSVYTPIPLSEIAREVFTAQ
jgi:hypothetical protein